MVVLYKVDGSKILGIAFGAVLLGFIAYMGAANAQVMLRKSFKAVKRY